VGYIDNVKTQIVAVDKFGNLLQVALVQFPVDGIPGFLGDSLRTYNETAIDSSLLGSYRVTVPFSKTLANLCEDFAGSRLSCNFPRNLFYLHDNSIVDSFTELARLPHDKIFPVLLFSAMVMVHILKTHRSE
jgi:hypothetical protein